MKQAPDPSPDLRLMPREMRQMSERVFSLTSIPRGFSLTLVDVPMLSQHLGLGGFAMLNQSQGAISDADPRAIAVTYEVGDQLTVDLAGQHAWIGLNAILDLSAELVATHGRAEIAVQRATHPEEFAVAGALAPRTGLSIAVRHGRDGCFVTAVPAPIADPVMEQLNCHGALVPAELWWSIYDTARKALAPDTAVSRRHAGVQIINDDGTIVGRPDNDDEADIGFLARGRAVTTGEDCP